MHEPHRVCERHFLNLPGYNGGAFIRAYVEDTSAKEPKPDRFNDEKLYNPHPVLELEIADCSSHIYLELSIATPGQRQNSFHKIDTLISSLRAFREGLSQECEAFRERQQQIDS